MNAARTFKAALSASVCAITAAAGLGLAASTASAAGVYYVTATLPLAERAAPSTSSAVLGWLSHDEAVVIECQTTGTDVYGSSIWDRLTGGQYVSDYWVSTPVFARFTPGLPQCPATPPPAPGAPTVGATTAGDQGDLGQCTWWADYEFHAYSGLWPDFTGPNNGNAMYWAGNAAAKGWTVSAVPERWSVAVFPAWTNGAGADGHVAWVTGVSNGQITVSEENFTYGAGHLDVRTLTPASTVRYILAP